MISTDGMDVVAVVPTTDLAEDSIASHQEVRFTTNPSLIHLFDTETELSLL